MKKIYFLFVLISLHVTGFATTWYSQGTGDPSSTSNWNSVSTGTGSSPTNFTTSGDVFIMQTNMSGGSGTWTLGTGTTLQLSSVTFYDYFGTINCYNLSLTGSTNLYGETANYFYVSGDFSASGTSVMTNPPSWNYFYFTNTASSLSSPQHCTMTTTGSGNYTYMYVNTGVTVAFTANNTWNTSSSTFSISGTLDCGTYSFGGSCPFVLNSGATLYTGMAGGVNSAIVSTGGTTFATGATYGFTGTAAQVTGSLMPASLVSPAKLIINNAAGVTLSQSTANTNTTGALTFIAGNLNTGSNSLTIPGVSTAISGAGSSNYVIGTLMKTISGNSAINYEVGYSTTYTPMQLTLSSSGSSGSLGVAVTHGLHASVGTSGLRGGQMVNDYWTITNSGAAGPATVIPLATYPSGDILGGAGNSGFVTRNYSASSWLGPYQTTNNTSPTTSATTTGVPLASLAGDYIFGIMGGISGNLSVCPGLSSTLTDSISGGTWSSGSPTVAAIGSISGIVTGLSGGTSIITYTIGGATSIATVTVVPIAAITGTSIVCIGNATPFTHSTSGGTWSSSNPAQASVGSSTGLVTGLTSGTATITYTLPGGCISTLPVTVNASPASITGTSSVCPGFTTALGDATTGGTWSSSNTSLATVGSSSGVVTGIAGGNPVISYTSAAGCSATQTMTVNSMAPILGVLGVCATGITSSLTDATPGGTWSSSNTGVATIGSISGVATSIGSGVSTITYTVASTGCIATAVFGVTGTPNVYTVTGGGGYCAGGTGVSIGLSGSDAGVSYRLFNGSALAGTAISGVGYGFSFPPMATAGTYSVIANPGSACATTMTGSATVVINPLPTAFSVTGGGSYCTGGTGVHVGLGTSTIGVNYQLFNGTTAIGSPVSGTGAALDFGLLTATGTYTVFATNTTTGCVNNMSGSVTISTNLLPTVYSVTGGGAYCSGGSGVTVGLSGSDAGVSYQLYFGGSPVSGAVVSGTGSAFSFVSPITAGGSYTVVATNTTTGCISTMAGSATVVVNVLPTVFNVTGGGAYCVGGTGVHIGLNASTVGVNYQIYRGTTAVGAPIAGTGVSLDFGLFTIVGSYTISATNATTGCTMNMSGSASVSTNPLPNLYTVTGGGGYCSGGSGVHVGLNSSEPGIIYQLYNGSSLWSASAGTGSAIDFGLETAAGFYSITATNSITGCISTMTGGVTVSINPLPVIFAVTGGGSYCAGGTGVHIGTTSSTTGVNYQLFAGSSPSGTFVAGTGFGLDFGLKTAAGSYTVVATNPTTSCTNIMSSSASVNINPLPPASAVTGGGGYCAGGTGVHIGVSGSITGVSYQLYISGTSLSGSPVAGTGSAIDFGLRTVAGTYTVVGINTTTGCSGNMTGSVVVTVNPLPTAYNVTGGGGYCAGSSGSVVGLNTSTIGVSYQLINGSTPIGTAIPGSGTSISFGPQTVAGTYTVIATNTVTGCSNTMSGSVVVGVNPLPTAFNVTGGGSYCTGGTGVHIGLSASTPGIGYVLYNSGLPVTLPMSGTGAALDFGLRTAPGTYTIVATNTATSCTNTMAGSAVVSINPLPAIFLLTGGGNYCFGTPGVDIGLSGSAVGTNYQLYLGSSLVGPPLVGTGSSLDFGMQTSVGTYNIIATNTVTGCTTNMGGSTNVNINPLPVLHLVTGGGNYCPGGTGVHVYINGSETGINYQLFNGSSTIGPVIPGTGLIIDFGLQTAPGTYTVVATDAVTGCSAGMTGSVAVGISSLPAAFNVTGTGNYCPGGAGVHVGLSGSDLGTSYQLYNTTGPAGTTIAGTGLVIDFGLELTGTYTVIATSGTTFCSNNMNGSAIVTISALPTSYNVTGGGSYCAGGTGVHIGLDGSDPGISYQLSLSGIPAGSPMTGTGSALDFGLKTAGGTYTVIALSSTTTCSNNMTGSSLITVNPLPIVFTVTGGGNYCTGGTGVHVMLSGSTVGINYQLFRGLTAIGAPWAGTGLIIDFGLQTVAGTYTVVATNTGTACTNSMTGSVSVGINALPVAYTVSGGGNYCTGGTGVHVMLSGSNTGISYQLYRAGFGMVGAPMAGTGFGLDFGLQTAAGNYTVVATNTSTMCVNNMTGSVSVGINPLPNVYNVTSTSSNYCIGGTGVDVYLSGSEVGVNYQLYLAGTAVGSPLPGTGTSVHFGAQLAAGMYTAVAINASTSCTHNMASSVTVVIDPLPIAYSMTGGGGYCNGTAGVPVGLSGSNAGVMYQLYLDGTPTGSPVSGTGSAISFGIRSATGAYTVIANNPATTCVNNMSGVATVVMNSLPYVYTITGGGTYCASGSGVHVGLSGSQSGVNYQLYVGSLAAGAPVAGTGLGIDFGLLTSAGTYTVIATNPSTTCTRNMLGTVTVGINPSPTAYSVIGGGNYCPGGPGLHVGISGSQADVTYLLYNGSTIIGTGMTGSGPAIDFGLQTTAGTYTVVGTNNINGCTGNMSGSVPVIINTPPAVFAVTGGGSFCSGTGGVHVGLNGSNSGVNYQLFNGFTAVGSPVAGTGGILDMGIITTGATYTVIATDNTTGCTMPMAGNAIVTVNPSVTPIVNISTPAGDTICSGTFTTFTAVATNGGTPPVYQWKVNGVIAGFSNNYSYIPLNGDVLTVTLTSNALCASPATVNRSVTLNVLPQGTPAVSIAAFPGNEVCQGTTVNYTATPSFGGPTPVYSWIKNGSNIGTTANFSYAPANGDDIYCIMTSNYHCRLTSSGVSSHINMIVDVSTTPTVTVTASPSTNIFAGQPVTFTANVTGAGAAPAYQWSVNGIQVPTATNQTYTTSALNNGDDVSCSIVSGGGCAGNVGSGSLTVHISNVGVQPVSLSGSDIRLVPNPNKGTFMLKGTLGTTTDEEISVEVTDMLGQVVYTSKVLTHNGELNERIQTSNTLANGMYILSLRSGSENKVFHLVIEQ